MSLDRNVQFFAATMFLGIISCCLLPVIGEAGEYPLGDIGNCPTISPVNSSQPFYHMEVLPGTGFDSL